MSRPGIQQSFFSMEAEERLSITLHVMCSASGLPPPQQAEGVNQAYHMCTLPQALTPNEMCAQY